MVQIKLLQLKVKLLIQLPNNEVNPENNNNNSYKVNILVKDDYEHTVQGAKVILLSGNSSYNSEETESTGKVTINDVLPGTYSVDIILPEGDDYELLGNYDDIIVDNEDINVELVLHRATMYVEEGD